jgi:glyoxylase-like metal-dependent hydrolase (beta-lactamase superfamily II)
MMQIDSALDCEVLAQPEDAWFDWQGGLGSKHADWANHPELLRDGFLSFSFGGFVLRGGVLGTRTVLIDCGNGPSGDDFIPPGHLIDSLEQLGVAPEDVTDVLLTHLHYDHTGWLAVDGVPTFPRATIRCSHKDVAHFTKEDTPGRSAEVTPLLLSAIQDQLDPFDGSCTLLPGLDALPAPGHTPGSTIFVASEGERRVVFLGDVVHCPVQLLEEEWAALSDVDPVLARQTRDRVIAELEGAEIAGAHFPHLALGRLVTSSRPKSWIVNGHRDKPGTATV